MHPRHAAMADRRLLFVGGAAVFGAIVLLVLIITGGRNRVRESKGAPDISPELLGADVPDRDPASRVRIGTHQKASGDPLQSLQTGRGELEFTNDEGLLAFRYRWDRSDPLETGWNRFTNPQAWIYRTGTQLIHLSADEGMFLLAENRQPQAGVLKGRVVVSLYQTTEKRGAYLIDIASAVPTARFETDSLNFDALGLSGRTDDRVVARTADLIVIGKGMSLLFNEQLGRIEKLEIAERELIAYRQPAPQPAGPPAAASRSSSRPVRAAEGRAEPAGYSPPTSASSWQGVTPYRLTLTDEVIITKGEADELLVIHGRNLGADFAIKGSDFGGQLTGAPSSSLPEARWSPAASIEAPISNPVQDRWTQLASMPFGMIDPTQPELTFLGAARGIGPDDVRITGVGGLLLVPIDGTPVSLAGPDDLFATLDGDPVHIDYGSFYAVGSDLLYSKSQQVARLNCDRNHPLEAGLPDGARLTAVVPFDYQFEKQKGTLMGAGTLVGLVPRAPEPPAREESTNSSMKGLPEGFSVNWLDDFTVEFKSTEESSGLGKIAAAVFNGTVHVDDPNGYALDSQQLRIDFKDESQTRDQGIDSITATGEAMLRSAEGNVSGDELYVLFNESASGSSYPSQMTVTGHGRVVDAGGSIAAQYIQANLVEKSMASDEALPTLFGGSGRKSKDTGLESSSPALGVSDLLAQGGVVLSFDDGVMAMADRLEADARTDTAVLTGEKVIVSDPSIKVMGRRAEITNISSTTQKRVARFIGAGTLTVFQQNVRAPSTQGRPVTTPEQMREELQRRLDGEPTEPPAPNGDESPNTSSTDSDEVGSVHVEWADLLTFEEEEGRITFEGAVAADSEPSARETDRLTGNWMQIELTDPIPTMTPTGAEGKAVRRLRKMTMLGGRDQPAQIEAQRFADDDRTQRELLLAVASEIIEYTEATELFEASGDGWMLVVDSRPKEESKPSGERDPSNAAVQFSGPGETEFSWTGKMTLQGGPGLLTISDGVVMRHRPDADSVIRVDCDTMTASLKAHAPVSALDLSKSDGMELTSAVADGAVYVRREDRSIWADHLTYDRTKLLATVESFGDNYVVMQSDSTGGAVQAHRILWDFFSNGITLEGARVDGPMPAVGAGR